MHAFTTQQLIGGPRYGGKVRIGNWNEDEARVELAAKQYELRRSNGELLHLRKEREKAFQSRQVPHTYSATGQVQYGDSVQLAIELEGCRYMLASNMFAQGPAGLRVTASPRPTAEVRNVFVITKPKSSSELMTTATARAEGALRYGDRVFLVSNPELTADPETHVVGPPFLLRSHRTDNILGTGRKNKQEVTMSTTVDASAEWIVSAADGDRLLSDATPVLVAQPFQLIHAMSNQPLAATLADTFSTDFGAELDVHCHTYTKAGHTSMTASGELPVHVAEPPNRWMIIMAASPEAAASVQQYVPLSAESLLDRARFSIAQHGGFHGIRSLALALAALDERGSGVVPASSAKWAFLEHGVRQSDSEYRLMFEPLCDAGYVRIASLLAAMQGAGLSQERATIVQLAYAHLSQKASGHLSVGQLKSWYDAKLDPRVVHKRLTAVEAAAEFGRQWPAHPQLSDPVTLAQLSEYYENVSACIMDDEEFVGMVANVWHVPERGTWKGKKGKRVLITFHKGSSTEAVVPNGEDIADDDVAALTLAVRAMGFGGVARVKAIGLVAN